MQQNLYMTKQSSQREIKVILEFPAKSSKDDLIKKEVKAIMISALQDILIKARRQYNEES